MFLTDEEKKALEGISGWLEAELEIPRPDGKFYSDVKKLLTKGLAVVNKLTDEPDWTTVKQGDTILIKAEIDTLPDEYGLLDVTVYSKAVKYQTFTVSKNICLLG